MFFQSLRESFVTGMQRLAHSTEYPLSAELPIILDKEGYYGNHHHKMIPLGDSANLPYFICKQFLLSLK
jgi:hypothetical protein